MKVVTTKVYQYDELDESAKEKALETFYDINIDHDWWDSCYDDFEQLCESLGITVDLKKTWFNGFGIQGQGSSFTGSFDLATFLVNLKAGKHLAYAPNDAPDLSLPDVDRRVLRLVESGSLEVYCQISPCNRETSVSVSVDINDNGYNGQSNLSRVMDAAANLESYCEEVAEELNHWLFSTLEKNYDYYTSQEAIEETIRINEYDFNENGHFPAYA